MMICYIRLERREIFYGIVSGVEGERADMTLWFCWPAKQVDGRALISPSHRARSEMEAMSG